MTGPAAAGSARQLLEAIVAGDRPTVARLLGDDPTLTEGAIDGVSPLQAACAMATDDGAIPARDGGPTAHGIVDDLLLAGADPDRRDAQGGTPLHAAGLCGNVTLIDRLLAAGADRSATIGQVPGSTPLSFALFYAHAEAAARLDGDQRFPDDLRSAAGLDDVAGIDRLLDADGAPTPEASAGMAFTAPIDAFPPRTGPVTDRLTVDESLTWASRNGALAAMAELVARGADVNANPYRGTALLWATYANRVDAARWLLANGADPNLRHDFGGAEHGRQATALHLAAQFGALDSIELLLGAGADPTVRDAAFDGTPRDWAEHSDQRAAVALLDR